MTRDTRGMAGCGYGLAIFILGGAFGVMPILFLVIINVVTLYGSAENEWFRKHGSVQSAIVTAKAEHTRASEPNFVVQYRIDGSIPPIDDQDAVSSEQWEQAVVGQPILVWVAGDKTRVVREDYSVGLRIYWLLLVPLASFTVLFLILRRGYRRSAWMDQIVSVRNEPLL